MVAAARALFHLPYRHARMALAKDPGGIDFRSERTDDAAPGIDTRYEPIGQPLPAAVGALEHFLVERYILYTSWDGTLWQGRVHHEPYPLQGARVDLRREDLVAAASITRPDTPPPLVHFAREVNVEIFGLIDVGGAAPHPPNPPLRSPK